MKQNRQWEGLEFRDFCFMYQHILLRIADRSGVCHEDAEELVQDVLVRAYFKLDPDSSPLGAKRWLKTTSSRLVIDRARKAGKSRTRLMTDTELVNHEASSDESSKLKELVVAAMSKLPSGEQDVIELRYWEGYTQTETAEVLEIKQGTVCKREARALQQLHYLVDLDLKS